MPGPPPLILLVEEEPDVSEVIADLLELDGARFRIEIASNYDDGVVLLNASQPALLIANVLLPGGGDGLRLAEVARRIDVPTLLISGEPELIAKEAQGLPFLSKPFRLPELQQAIRTLIDGEPVATDLEPAKPG
jgi:DNA-binding response OmpR family regulator